jgi:SRSO17 transposase
MTPEQIAKLGTELAEFLGEFADCFRRPETRLHLEDYVRGQLSDLPRKSVEPIALFNGVEPRTLQEFLGTDVWDQARLRGHVHRIVARDHADPDAIGIIDESGHPKKGTKTACVQRQYCGNTGKIDNCVVTVHLAYARYDTAFRTMLDSTPYLPQSWHLDRPRCRLARIPDNVVYRPKYVIALEQLDRAMASGVVFGWITADEWYAEKPDFLAGLEARQLRYVVEIPRNFSGWLDDPGHEPRYRARPVEELCRHSRPLSRQPWERFHLKDTDKGPMVWEARAARLWLCRGTVVLGPYWLVHARNVLDPREAKFFLSNAGPETRLETLLHVGFARWPVERCLEDKKTELGLSHFEVRNYPALERHLLITLVSHLFLTRQTDRLRGEKPTHHALPGPHRRQRLARQLAIAP